MKLTAEVVDPAFVEVNDAQVVAQVKSPSGKIIEVPLEWTVSKDGEYTRHVRRRRAGPLRGEGQRGAATRPTSARARMHSRASAGDSEYFDAAMRSPLLKRMAEETGGRFFTPAERRRAARSDQLQRPRRDRRRRSATCGTCRSS